MTFKDTKEGQTNYCEACEARGNGGLRHTCGIEPQIKQCERCGMTELDFVKKGILCNFKINNGQHTFQDIAPMGVSQWKNHGIKYGYDKYFGIEWDRNCNCVEPEPIGEIMVGQGEGSFRSCARCKGRIWN